MSFPKFYSAAKFGLEVSKQAMETCEHIISEIGAELHDDLIQKLSVLRLHMDKIERASFNPTDTREAMIKMQADFQGIVDSIQRISRRLHPVKMEDDSFHKRIEMLCQNMDTPGAIRIHAFFAGTPKELDSLTESYSLRMIQELIHNALRHSAAWHVWVRIYWDLTFLRIEVEDDGSGFARIDEFINLLKKKHNTLRMRAEAINARIKYQPGEKGLLATIKVPIQL